MVANWQPNLPQWFCNSVGSSVVDWTADQLKSVQQFFAQNAPTAAQIQQWTTDRLSNHQPYDIVAGMGWRKSRVELKKIRGQLWNNQPLTTVLMEQWKADPAQVGTQLLQAGNQR